jgi:hypothetical protein
MNTITCSQNYTSNSAVFQLNKYSVFILQSNSTSTENKQYQSLHRELEPPSPAYESYRLPQKSGPESGSRANEAVNGE